MRVPTALAALTLSAALLLTLPAAASAHVSPLLQTTVLEPAPGTAGTLPPAPVEPPDVITAPPAPPAPPVPTSAPAPAPVVPAPVPVVPAPAPVPSDVPAPTPAPAPSSAAPTAGPTPSSPATTASPVPSATEPDGGTTAPAVEGDATRQEVGQAEGMPARAAVVPRTARTPVVTTSPAPRTAAPSASASATQVAVAPGADDAEAGSPLAAAEPAARYVAAGVLSIIAVVLALAIAFVAQPRRIRHTH